MQNREAFIRQLNNLSKGKLIETVVEILEQLNEINQDVLEKVDHFGRRKK
jgi:hypothetical protein